MRFWRAIARTVAVAALAGALVRCSSSVEIVTPTPARANAFTEKYAVLSPNTVTSLTEVAQLTAAAYMSKASAVAYSLDANTVLAAYAEEGYVVRWDLATGDIIEEQHLGIVSPRGLGFDISGNVLMGPTAREVDTASPDAAEHVNGIGLWDTRTGKLIRCLTHPCTGNVPGRDGYLGAKMDTTGSWVLIYSEWGFSTLDLTGASAGRISLINSPDSAYGWRLGTIAVDAAHRRIALVLSEGGIWLDSLDGSMRNYQTLVDGVKNANRTIHDAVFDLAGQWLGILIDDTLSVWQMKAKPDKPYLEATVSNGIAIRFDQTGSLLLVAGGDRLLVWNLADKTRMAEFRTPGITSLGVSQDNRLVLWGDADGSIHVWGTALP